MGDNGVASVDDLRVVAAFVKHAHVKVQHIGQIHSPSGRAFIRADRHHVVAVDLQVIKSAQKPFHELIGRAHRLEAVQRDCILHPRIVGVEGNNIVCAHAHQLLKSKGAV